MLLRRRSDSVIIDVAVFKMDQSERFYRADDCLLLLEILEGWYFYIYYMGIDDLLC